MYQKILIRYGELTTKGDNRIDFTNKLANNFRKIHQLEPIILFDRMILDYSESNLQELENVMGISSFSPCIEVLSNIDNIKKGLIEFASYLSNNSKTKINKFCISSQRNWKGFSYSSNELNIELGSLINNEFQWKVDLRTPDVTLFVEIRKEKTYIFNKKIKSWGGYPVGINGKVLMMLSGGIDSPIASFELMKRGIHVDFLSFISPPYTDEKIVQKIKEIVNHLSKFQGSAYLTFYNYSKLMSTIEFISKTSYRIIIMRRSFYRISTVLAKKYNYLAIANGENIGQVASQTLESISVIHSQTDLPILSPLITANKNDTIELARKINTYSISIRAAKESCEIFAPKKPTTKPQYNKCVELENEIPELKELELSELEFIEKFKINSINYEKIEN